MCCQEIYDSRRQSSEELDIKVRVGVASRNMRSCDLFYFVLKFIL